ncbi:MAG: Bax inhibitor-1 family protein [Candidatus Comchoanobacterales bacterium]
MFDYFKTFNEKLKTALRSNTFIAKTLQYLALGVFITTTTACLFAFLMPALIPGYFGSTLSVYLFYGSFILSILAAFSIPFLRGRKKSLVRAFALIASTQGYLLSHLIFACSQLPGGSMMLVTALIGTTVALGITTILAYKGYFNRMIQVNVTVLLIALILSGLMTSLLHLPAAAFLYSLASVGIFCFILGIDFARAISLSSQQDLSNDDTLPIIIALNILLDLINIFTHILRLCIESKEDKSASIQYLQGFIVMAIFAIPYCIYAIAKEIYQYCYPSSPSTATYRQEVNSGHFNDRRNTGQTSYHPLDARNTHACDRSETLLPH